MDTKPKRGDEDITRIEDLSPFEHEGEENFEDFQPQEEIMEQEQEVFLDVPESPPLSPMEELATEVNAMQIQPTILEAEPPFSFFISDIKSETDKIFIRSALKRVGLYQDEQMAELFERSLERGSVLVSHISEFVANYLYQDLLKTKSQLMVTRTADAAPQGESYASMQLNRTQEEDFTTNDSKLLVSPNSQISGYEVVETIGPLIQTLWIELPSEGVESLNDLRRLPSIRQEIRLRKGNAITNWKVELVKAGKNRQQKILCSGIIVHVGDL